ncbi:MAG: 5'-nucleotidase C-terminal domain-containing protein [Lutispora sp.]|nr:5'-nucleotidase C-terminal domain-containing protein [Lutispora sp.]
MRKGLKHVSIMLTLLMILSMLLPMTTVLAEDSNAKTITILGTSDLHGRIYPWEYAAGKADDKSGLAKIQTLVKQEKAANPNTLLIDCGDAVQGNLADLFNDQPVHPMVEAFNYMGYDAWTIGNHEFNFNLEFLNRNVAAFKGSVLVANIYKEDGTRVFEPYKVFEKDGIRVAVVGITAPHVPIWESSNPDRFKGMTFTDPVEEAKKAVKELEGKYDVLIGTFHLGDTAEKGATDGALPIAEAVPEFNAIFCGHKHAKFDNITSNSGVKLIEAGTNGAALAKVDVSVVKEGSNWVVKEVTTKNLDVVVDTETDKELLEKFAYVDEKSKKEAATEVGKVTADFVKGVDYFTGEDKITTMPRAQLEDNAITDLINEVQMYYAKTDISAAALFDIDANVKAGPFRLQDAAKIYKYDNNTLVGLKITGKNLKAYMEWSVGYYNQYKDGDLTISFNSDIRAYNYDMFSGVNYDIDISKPAGSRIVNLTYKGQPINDDTVYKLSLNDYRFGTLKTLKLATDEDKFYPTKDQEGVQDSMRTLVLKYVQEVMKGVVTPTVDNNWKIIGTNFETEKYKEYYDQIKSGEIKIPSSFDGRTPNVKSISIDDLAKLGKVPNTKVISILSVNDFHGNIVESGKNPGAARLAGYFKAQKAENPDGTIILSAGDMYQGTADSNLMYGVPVQAIMNYIGFEGMAMGNHEFDWGMKSIDKWQSFSKFPFLAANLIDKKTGEVADFVKPYIIVERNGIKIGIIGIATPETETKTKAEMVEPYIFKDPAETVNALVPKVKEDGADLVVVLSHLGAMQDSKTKEITGEAADFAKAVKGVDAIITGHSHQTVQGEVNDIPVVQAYYNGRSVAHIDLYLDADKKISKTKAYIDANVIKAPEDPQLKGYLKFIDKELSPIKNVLLGKATATMNHDTAATQISPVGNFVTDIMRKAAKADIAIQNGGGLRRDIPEGDITMGLMYELLPFDNTLFTFDLTGKQVKEAIEHGIILNNEKTFRAGQFSGLKVKYDSSKARGERIVDITLLDGTPLVDDKVYKVVTNDFQATGGDEYVMFKEGKNTFDTNIPIRDVIVNEIKELNVISPIEDHRLIDVADKNSMMIPFEFDLAA